MLDTKQAIVIDARDIPNSVEIQNWLSDREIYTHYSNSLFSVLNDGNPFSEWLKSEGYKFNKKSKYGDWIGIIGT